MLGRERRSVITVINKVVTNTAVNIACTAVLSPPRKYRVFKPRPGVSSREALWSLGHDPWPVEGTRVKLLAADVRKSELSCGCQSDLLRDYTALCRELYVLRYRRQLHATGCS